jgi:hypothetical protein
MTLSPQDSLRLSSQLYPHVPPGEEVLWSGRPDPAVVFADMDALYVPFIIVWFAAAAIVAYKVIRIDALGGSLVMGPFLAVGSYALVGRFGHKRHRKQRTLYALTSDYVIIMVGRAVSVDRISHMEALTARSADGRHVEVRFEAPGDPRGLWIGGRMPVMGSPRLGKLMGNMGMELRDRSKSPLAFYDIADADALMTALERSNAVLIKAADADGAQERDA